MRQLGNKGIAIIVAIAFMVIIGGIATLLMTRAVSEVRHSSDNVAIVQTLMLARGGANLAGRTLIGPVRTEVEKLVEASAFAGTNSSNNWVIGGNGDEPDFKKVADDLTAIATQLQPEVDKLFCDVDIAPNDTESTINIRLYITDRACATASSAGEPLPADIKLPLPRFVDGSSRNGSGEFVPQSYAIPYVLVSEGSFGEYRRRIVLQGEYQIEMGRGSFAKYALFTNHHTSGNNSPIWFTDNTLFDGPVHTNEFFKFYRDPWFGGKVTSAGCSNPGDTKCDGSFNRQGAEFLNIGFRSVSDMYNPSSPSYTDTIPQTHAPIISNGVDWAASHVKLPENNSDQRKAAQVGGIFLDGDIDKIEMYAGNANGNVVTNGNASHQYIKISYQKEVTEEVETEVQVQVGTTSSGWQWVTEGCGEGYIWQNGWRWRNNTCQDRYVWNDGDPIYETQIVTEEITVTRSFTDTYRTSKSAPDDLFLLADGFTDWDADGQPALNRGDLLGETPQVIGTAGKKFTGVIYSSGDIHRVTGPSRNPSTSTNASDARPALASYSKLTITADNDIRITGDLAYEDSPCTSSATRNSDRTVTPAVCNALNAQNVLGMYVDDGDILIGNANSDSSQNAPDNVVIQAVLMSGKGEVTVENYGSGFSRGTVNLTGGIIENYYGGFGTFDSSTGTMQTGYSRNFTYDPRMAAGMAPPFFPVIVEDKLANVTAFSYGQREQIY